MTGLDALLLVVGGLVAGVINTMAGGGSSLTVPLLVIAGVPGTLANGSNRVGILASNAAAVVGFVRGGVSGTAAGPAIIVPVVVGSLVGSYGVSQVSNEAFETLFGLLMVPVVVATLVRRGEPSASRTWPLGATIVVFFAVGLYGGAFQVGVGLFMLAALTRAGFDLVTANSVKVLVNVLVTLVALPVFILEGKVRWGPALVLAVGFTIGGWLGAKIAVRGGSDVIRIVMLVAAVGLSGRLLGLWG